jgi:predicted RND superfamily exporter protein
VRPFLSSLYEQLVLRAPWLSLFMVALLVAGFATQIPKIKLDASADSLMLQGDPSLEIYQRTFY